MTPSGWSYRPLLASWRHWQSLNQWCLWQRTAGIETAPNRLLVANERRALRKARARRRDAR